MLRSARRLLGPSGAATLAALVAVAGLLTGCGSGTTTTGGHDSPQGAAQGFLNALGAYDGSPTSLQRLLDWVPPSKRSAAQESFSGLGAAGGSTRFQLADVSIGSATVTGDTATVSVHAMLSICVTGTVGSQSYSTCPPAPVSPNGSFDTLTCVREQGQWYVADYSASGGGGSGGTPLPAPADTGTVAPATGGSQTSAGAST
jgi:hypothetical protein